MAPRARKCCLHYSQFPDKVGFAWPQLLVSLSALFSRSSWGACATPPSRSQRERSAASIRTRLSLELGSWGYLGVKRGHPASYVGQAMGDKDFVNIDDLNGPVPVRSQIRSHAVVRCRNHQHAVRVGWQEANSLSLPPSLPRSLARSLCQMTRAQCAPNVHDALVNATASNGIWLKTGRLLDAQRKPECCVTGERD